MTPAPGSAAPAPAVAASAGAGDAGSSPEEPASAAAPAEPVRQIVLPPPVFRSAPGSAARPGPSAPHPMAGIGRHLRRAATSPALVAGLGVALVALGGISAWREWTRVRGAPVLSVLHTTPTPIVMVRIDPPTGHIKVTIIDAEPPAGARYALWLVTPNGGSHLLARFSGSADVVSPVLRRLGRGTLAASSLNVTLEPSEAAAGGGAVAPEVIYRGRLITE